MTKQELRHIAKQQYIDFINWYNPHWEAYEDPDDVINISLPSMLYNLEEIKKELEELNEPCNDWTTTLIKIKTVIAAFKAAGIKTE